VKFYYEFYYSVPYLCKLSDSSGNFVDNIRNAIKLSWVISYVIAKLKTNVSETGSASIIRVDIIEITRENFVVFIHCESLKPCK